MKKRIAEQKVSQYFNTVPHENDEALEATIRAAAKERNRLLSQKKKRVRLSPNMKELFLAQMKTTKTALWAMQAIVVIAAITAITVSSEAPVSLATLIAMSAIVCGISIAGLFYEKDSVLTEISYSCHFTYKQIVLVRMAIFGLMDLLNLSVLIVVGSAILPYGFADVALGSCLSFFLSGFLCMLLVTRYRGDVAALLCIVLSSIVAAFLAYLWTHHYSFIHTASIAFWLLLIAVAIIGMSYCARSMLANISAGYEHIQSKWTRR